MRLTNKIRDRIINRAINHKYDPIASEHTVLTHQYATALFDIAFDDFIRDSKGLNPQYFGTVKKIKVNVDGMSFTLDLPDARSIPYKDSHHGYWYDNTANLGAEVFIKSKGGYKAAVTKLQYDIEDTKAAKSKDYANLKAKLYSINTLKQLHEMWPEGEPFYKDIVPVKTTAIAIRFDDINKALDLPIEETV